MKKFALFAAPLLILALVGCNSPEMGAAATELKTAAKAAAGDALKEAGVAAGDLMSTQNACMLAGQSEVFCGCLATELGPQLDASHLSGLTSALSSTVEGDAGGAIKEAANVDPDTRAALAKCGTRAAIAGAVGQ